MKAMVARRSNPDGRRTLVLRELPLPEPGPGEIRIRVEACGVCRTDLHILEGDLGPGRPELVPGHQIVGTVEATGAGAEGFRIGDRAGVSWLHWTCGVCEYCSTGRENLCEEARFTGWDADGGYAEAMIVPAAYAFPIPEALDAMAAAPLLCAGVIGYRSLKLSGIRPGEALGLFGFGASAHLALQVALRWGCRVYAFTRNEAHRRHALDLGAAWAGSLEEEPPERLHAAVTFAPAGAVAARALSLLRRGGTVAINAVHMDDLPPVPFAHLYHERAIRTVANLTRTDVREFLGMAAEEPFRVSVNPFPLERAEDALDRLKASAFLGAAVLEVRSAGTANGIDGGTGAGPRKP
jgi:propanol-preferring alcohol dehydrogenase